MPSGSVLKLMSMRSAGSEFTNSVKMRAGIVTSPSSWTSAPIHVVMATSRFVATSLSLPWSVDIRTLDVIGSVALAATALPTTVSPRLRFSCRQESCIRRSLRNWWR